MSGLITRENYRRRPTRFLFINGVAYSNSAAKFWPALMDEARFLDPAIRKIAIRGTSAGEIERRQLFPGLLHEKEMEQLLHGDLEKMMRQTAAELELTGPPPSVIIDLFTESDVNILRTELPPDTIDADLLPFFLVWLLRWAAIDEAKWNNEFLEGSFKAEDKHNNKLYNFSFILHNRSLSEKMYDRTCTLFL